MCLFCCTFAVVLQVPLYAFNQHLVFKVLQLPTDAVHYYSTTDAVHCYSTTDAVHY